jgi:hypothetical protein
MILRQSNSKIDTNNGGISLVFHIRIISLFQKLMGMGRNGLYKEPKKLVQEQILL